MADIRPAHPSPEYNLGEAATAIRKAKDSKQWGRHGGGGGRQDIHIWTVSTLAEGKARRRVLGSPRVAADSQLYFPLQSYR